MDEFKRTYSNQDILTKAIPYFWEKFEKENYSLWYCEYQEDVSDMTMAFMASNLVQGMFQRLDKLRKNAFASMVIYGERKDYKITGLWFWKGQDLAFELSEDWSIDYGSYSWKKLDADSEETKKLVELYFIQNEKDFNGIELQDSKVFK